MKDYKHKLTVFMTEESFNRKFKELSFAKQQLLQHLNINCWDKIALILSQNNPLLKFFTYKVLTRKGMPAFGFDADSAFFGRFSSIKRSPLVTPWQIVKLHNQWTPDTMNSFTRLWKLFLNLTLPDIFRGGNNLISFSVCWPDELIRQTTSQIELKQKLCEIKQYLTKISGDNQLKLYSYFILLNEPLQRLLESEIDDDLLYNIKLFAKLTHTPGNFMLLPAAEVFKKGNNRYEIKNNKYGDFADLYIQSKNELFVKKQYLQMYQKPLFIRKEDKHLPYNEETLITCVREINKRIKERELLLLEAYKNRIN